ncbi:DNA replication factor Cdt1 [Nasonia vitripennis]|uniref:CDT1 Geminin-binding domain-containing protein n=1 Tax=Nasonia vitripennis TaxID=7425 RepID=A0A7M7G4K6_NASVI|nr:DNA replication factor Cdt1 [Nasonia vitripennis]
MSQQSVTAYFHTRKRRASEELRAKSKVLILDDNDRRQVLDLIPEDNSTRSSEHQTQPVKSNKSKMETKKDMVARNLQFDLSSKSSKSTSRSRATRANAKKTIVLEDGQTDIRETLLKVNKEIEEDKKVVFEKLGCLSPKKSTKKRVTKTVKPSQAEEKIQEPAYFKTPTKESPMKNKDMSLDEIKAKITTSSRIAELRARINKFKSCEDKLEKLNQMQQDRKEQAKKNEERVKIKEFERIQLEIPVSPQKSLQSPNKFFSPTKTIQLSPKASPARRLLFEPKEAPASPVKGSPTKTPAYQKYQSLVDTGGKALALPYKYRFLAEVFRSIDTIAAMLYNRKENVTFSKLRPAVQELVRRDFTLEHLAQIKTIYPDAFNFQQTKMRGFGVNNTEKYELVITPFAELEKEKSGRNTPDADNVLKSAQETIMGPNVVLERKRKFYNALLDIVKDEHEKFLRSLDPPMVIPKDKITRWHPEFDIEACKDIEKSELPKPPTREKLATAKDVLEKANIMFNNSSRMQKAIEMLADNRAKMDNATITNTELPGTTEPLRNVDISIVDTPPATPKTIKPSTNPLLKGIPLSLLEKVRAKQAAKAMEMMTRSTDQSKEAVMYTRLPEMAKILRNIFVSEKKGVLPLEFAVKKLDDSYRTKLTLNELEEHIRLMSKLLPLWATIPVVRKVEYLKLARDFDMTKVIKRLEVLADEKV